MNKYILAAAMLAAGSSAFAVQREFSYPAEGAQLQYFGNSKAETYDMAIRISDPALVGSKITSVSVAIFDDATVTNPKGWLSTALLLDSKKKNAPDIATVDAALTDDNVLTATFDEPYTLTAEGVYVGYSITIAKVSTFGDQNPNPVATCVNTDGCYIHSTRTNLKWSTLSQYGVASTMAVTLEGDFADNAVAVMKVADVRTDGQCNTVTVPVTVANYGVGEVNSLEFSYKYGSEEAATVSATLAEPVPAKFGSSRELELSLPTCFESTELTVSVSKVNGSANGMASASATGRYTMMAFVPVMRPLMEEYTGLWCGWCPRGFVAMEEMSELYPDDFVCVSYHSNGSGNARIGGEALQYITDEEFPNTPPGYPTAFLNRGMQTDPYYGNSNDAFGINSLWLELRREQCVADIDVKLAWADDSFTRLTCTSTTKFIEEVNGEDYRVDYIITGDGFKTFYVKGDNGATDRAKSVILAQTNNYNGATPLDDSELWLQVVNGGNPCLGLVYNDVAMAISGAREAFDGTLKANTAYTHDFTFDYAEMKNYETASENGGAGRRNVLPADGSLRCVAVLLTADGQFVNCNKSAVLDAASIADVAADGHGADVVATEWYDLQGRRSSARGEGLRLRVDRLTDGSVRTDKVK